MSRKNKIGAAFTDDGFAMGNTNVLACMRIRPRPLTFLYRLRRNKLYVYFDMNIW